MQLAAGHVMVGQQQAVRADEGSRAAVVQADAREADVIEPCLCRREIVLLLELLERRIVEGPHAFVGNQAGDFQTADQAGQSETEDSGS